VPSRVDQLCRFERLGLKWNPFRTVAPLEKPDVYIPDLYQTSALARDVAFSDSRFTQVIARAGHGKSTFLAAVADLLSEADIPFDSLYLQPSLRTRVHAPQVDVRVLVLDEAERLTSPNLRKLIRWTHRGGRLIVSSHRDLSGEACGRPVSGGAVTIALPDITATGLQQFFLTRLRWADGSDDRFQLTADGADWLLSASEGNLRVAEAVLYEVFQVAADEIVAVPNSAASQDSAGSQNSAAARGLPLRIDSEQLSGLKEFARRRADFEAAGNVPYSRFQILAHRIREVTDKTSRWFSGRTSTPGPAERELPR
jgi:hypothetical protein